MQGGHDAAGLAARQHGQRHQHAAGQWRCTGTDLDDADGGVAAAAARLGGPRGQQWPDVLRRPQHAHHHVAPAHVRGHLTAARGGRCGSAVS